MQTTINWKHVDADLPDNDRTVYFLRTVEQTASSKHPTFTYLCIGNYDPRRELWYDQANTDRDCEPNDIYAGEVHYWAEEMKFDIVPEAKG